MLSILSLLRAGDYFSAMISVATRCFVVFCCMPLHEYAHAYVASKCGDETARAQGRLTPNPFAHLDLIGTLMIFLIGFGYAKPVPVNPARLKHPRRDFALISLAGPVSNLLISFILVFLAYIVAAIGGDNTAAQAIVTFFYMAGLINVMLAVFNFIPIPPLDGSRILTVILPDKIYFGIMKYERYIMIGFMAIVFFGWLDRPIIMISNALMSVIAIIPRLIFGFSI